MNAMVVFNKADLTSIVPKNGPFSHVMATHKISCATGEGLESLEKALSATVVRLLSPEGDGQRDDAISGTVITRERHRRHVKLCVGHLERFLLGTLPMDAAAEELRYPLLFASVFQKVMTSSWCPYFY